MHAFNTSLHELVVVSDLRTIEPSDYRNFGLSSRHQTDMSGASLKHYSKVIPKIVGVPSFETRCSWCLQLMSVCQFSTNNNTSTTNVFSVCNYRKLS